MDRKTVDFCCVFLMVVAVLLFHIQIVYAAPRGRAPASLIPQELKQTDIRNDYVTTGTKIVGVIQTVVGHVVVAKEDLSRGYYAAPGDRLYEKDVIFTLKGSRCRFKVSGEDVVTMAQNTRIGIKTFNEDARTQTKQSLFSLAKGKAMFYAMRLFRHRNASMQVETPTAVSGVRGTKWGVEVVELEGGKPVASLPIQVADTSDLGFRLLAATLPMAVPSIGPPMFQTTILCFSGTVFTGSTAPPPPGAPLPPVITLSMGQMTTVGTGAPPAPPSLTPLSLANSFLADTFVPGGGTPPPPPPPPPGGAPPPPPPPDTSGVVQQQNNAGASRPTNHWGYTSAAISETYTASPLERYFPLYYYENIANLDAAYTQSPSPKITVQGLAGSSPSITYLEVQRPDDIYEVINSGVPSSINRIELGYDPYTEWGYWTQPTAMSFDGNLTYYFDNRNYYIWGDRTTDAQMASLSAANVSGTYSGTAYGTYVKGDICLPETANMSGVFSAQVQFGTKTVSNFNINVSGGGHTVTITDASGTFSGLTSQFSVSPASGQWKIDGASTDIKGANGSVYGSSGQAIGGQWVTVKNGTDIGAYGIFQGKR